MRPVTFAWANESFGERKPIFEELIAHGEGIARGEAPDPARIGRWMEALDIGAELSERPGCQYARQWQNTVAAWRELCASEYPMQLAADRILPFLWELREELYFWHSVYPNEEAMQDYWKREFAPHHQRVLLSQEEAPEVTLFIPACNHLDHTKRCVESVLRHTDLEGRELLLVDHGSQDETYAYFQSIPQARVIRFKENVRMLMFSTAFRASRGRYLAFISNDTVVTEGWLEHLIDCLRAHPEGISATPVTPFTSNCQSMWSTSPEHLDWFAQGIFRGCRGDWRHRARIMPVIGVYRADLLEQIGFSDRWFYTMEFWDDDLSLRARRKGFKQFLCADVYCHHVGSVTGGGEWKQTLTEGRELFVQKHHVDPWGKGFCRAPGLVELMNGIELPPGKTELLAIDCGLGDSFFEIENAIRRMGGCPESYLLAEKEEDLLDTRMFAPKAHLATGIASSLETAFDGRKFDLIAAERTMAGMETRLADRLVSGGYLLVLEPFAGEAGLQLLAASGPWQLWRKRRETA